MAVCPPQSTLTKDLIEAALLEASRKLGPRRCQWCGEEFKPRRAWQVFCQQKCANAYHNHSQQIATVMKDRRIAQLEDFIRELEVENQQLRDQLKKGQ